MDSRKVPSKSRKLVFDDDTFKYQFESPAQTVARVSWHRQKIVSTHNRCEQKKLEGKLKRFHGMSEIFKNKLAGQMDTARANLREMVAHSRALKSVTHGSDLSSESSFGRYGMHASREDLMPLIEDEKRRMRPESIRREKSELLLRRRSKMPLMDRTMDTQSLFTTWRQRGATSFFKDTNKGRLVLPPIRLTLTKADDSGRPQSKQSIVFITELPNN